MNKRYPLLAASCCIFTDRVLWHATVWVLCLAGLTISVSGTVIGWRRLRRKLQNSQAKA